MELRLNNSSIIVLKSKKEEYKLNNSVPKSIVETHVSGGYTSSGFIRTLSNDMRIIYVEKAIFITCNLIPKLHINTSSLLISNFIYHNNKKLPYSFCILISRLY